MRSLKNTKFYTEEEVFDLIDLYRAKYVDEDKMNRAQGAAIQYYMSQFMYCPSTLIAHVFGRKPWHVNQTITRLTEAASESRTPVTMNESYRVYIEDVDDLARELYGGKNKEICMVLDQKEKAWLLWNAQKESGWFDDSSSTADQEEVVDELLRTIGLPPGGWMRDIIMENYVIDYHD